MAKMIKVESCRDCQYSTWSQRWNKWLCIKKGADIFLDLDNDIDQIHPDCPLEDTPDISEYKELLRDIVNKKDVCGNRLMDLLPKDLADRYNSLMEGERCPECDGKGVVPLSDYAPEISECSACSGTGKKG